jgi:hypothetical protein
VLRPGGKARIVRCSAPEGGKSFSQRRINFPFCVSAVKGGRTSHRSAGGGWRDGRGPRAPAACAPPGATRRYQIGGRWAPLAKPQSRAARRGTRRAEHPPHSGSKRWQTQETPCLARRGRVQKPESQAAISPSFDAVLPQSEQPHFPLRLNKSNYLSHLGCQMASLQLIRRSSFCCAT